MTISWSNTDVELDRRAFQMACEELPRAALSALLQRAQQIKLELKGQQANQVRP